jgi:dolichol kinase
VGSGRIRQLVFVHLTMSAKICLLIILFIWGIPSTYFRSKFRKIIYQTDDWKINIKPFFKKEIIGLFSNIYPENKDYLKTRNHYRFYLLIYLILFFFYSFSK